MAGARHSLHRSISEAPLFYSLYALFLVVAGAVVLIPGAPLGLITEGVQALAGILVLDTGVVLAAEKLTWRMPPLALLQRPAWSPGRRLGMISLRCYLAGAVALIIVKIIQLAAGH